MVKSYSYHMFINYFYMLDSCTDTHVFFYAYVLRTCSIIIIVQYIKKIPMFMSKFDLYDKNNLQIH